MMGRPLDWASCLKTNIVFDSSYDAPYKNLSLNSGAQLVSKPDSLDLKDNRFRPDGRTFPGQMNDGFGGIGPSGDGP